MSHLAIELALWVLLVFFIGCILGCLLRRLFARGEPSVAPEASSDAGAVPPAGAPVSQETAMPTASSQGEPLVAARPAGIAAARNGMPDNLQRISGVGPQNEKTLHSLGFFHFDQIAGWTPEEVAWVDDHLNFGGRIEREEWINQARLLAEGKEEEFRRLYGTGGMRDKDGEAKAGLRTAKD